MWLVSARDRARYGGATGRLGRRAAGVTAAATGLLLVAGCHSVGGSSNASLPTASGTVTVAATPGVADAPLYIAIKDGLFRQAGLTVHVVPGESIKSEVAALRSGRADIAFGDYADMFYAQELKSSPGLKIVANGYDAAPSTVEILTLPSSRITGPKGLANKIIGTAEPQEMATGQAPGQPCSPCSKPYSLETLAAWSVLSSDSVNPQKISWLPMPEGNLITALRKHQVNAILATEPTIYQAESEVGAVPVLDAATGATANLPLAGYFTSASYVKHHYAVLQAFRAALLKAQADGTMAGPVQTALTQYAHMDVQTASLVTLGTYPTSLQSTDLQRLVLLMFNFNALPLSTLPSVSSMIPKG